MQRISARSIDYGASGYHRVIRCATPRSIRFDRRRIGGFETGAGGSFVNRRGPTTSPESEGMKSRARSAWELTRLGVHVEPNIEVGDFAGADFVQADEAHFEINVKIAIFASRHPCWVTPDASDGPATKIPARAIRERWLTLNTQVCPGGHVLRGARIQYPCRQAFLPAPKVHERGF
jgi:hypothetical protein